MIRRGNVLTPLARIILRKWRADDLGRQTGQASYEDRRILQIAASVAVAVVVIVLVVWGLRWAWHYIKRYRLAIGLAGLTVGFGIIRFISLHEVDAWNAHAPWARMVVDLVAAAGVSALAIARLWQLSDFAGARHIGLTPER